MPDPTNVPSRAGVLLLLLPTVLLVLVLVLLQVPVSVVASSPVTVGDPSVTVRGGSVTAWLTADSAKCQ
jgi:hypothetical protein